VLLLRLIRQRGRSSSRRSHGPVGYAGTPDCRWPGFVLRPETLDVVVASNLFADSSRIWEVRWGSPGIAEANIDPERRYPSMFEPVHGSAPDIVGKGVATPISAIWSAALMLDHLGLSEEAARVMHTIKSACRDGILTPDLGGPCATGEVASGVR